MARDLLELAPPRDVETEAAVLGAVLVCPEVRAGVFKELTRADFSDPAHAALFGFLADVMYASLEPGEEPDAGAVAAALGGAGLLERVGGLDYLTTLADSFGTAASVPLHIKTLKALTLRRVALAGAHEVARTAARPDGDLGKALATFERRTRRATAPAQARPAPLPERLPFPVGALPPVTRRFVVEAAEALGVDLAYLALPTLAALASAIGNTRRLQVTREWVAPSVLWTGIVGESGTMKSPALRLALDFVHRREAAARQAHAERLNEYRPRALAYEVDLRAWKRGGKDAGEAPPVEPVRPKMERFIVSDVTVEALADRLEDAPRGLLLARDELSGWLGSFGAYKQGRGRDEANYLSMYDADSLQVDRKNPDRPSIYVPRAAVSICGGIQPRVLARLLTADSYECGLVARLLLTLPPRQIKTWRDGEVSQVAEDCMAAVYARLYGLAFIDPDGRGERPKTLHLTAEAREVLRAFVNRHGAETADLTGNLAAAYAKLDGAAARFALVLALARWAEDQTADGLGPDVVDAQDVEAGIALAEWFKVETRRVYSIFGETESERRRRQLVELLCRKGGMTARELQQSRSYATAAAAEAALKDLEGCGLAVGEYVRDPKGGPGKWVYRPTQPAADSEK